jgi:hypothetical protein
MIPRLTIRNITYLGLTQVGVIVAGVLGAGAAYKTYTVASITPLRMTVLAAEYGFLLLALPVAWITVALVIQQRQNPEEDPEIATFASGIILLVVLLILAFQAAASPILQIYGAFSGGLSV